MDTNATDALSKEAEAAIAPVEKAMEGLRHLLEHQDILDVTRADNEALLAEYRVRHQKLSLLTEINQEQRDAIVSLLEDGYPEEPSREVNGDVIGDMDQNLETMKVARSRFVLLPVTAGVTFEPVGEQHSP